MKERAVGTVMNKNLIFCEPGQEAVVIPCAEKEVISYWDLFKILGVGDLITAFFEKQNGELRLLTGRIIERKVTRGGTEMLVVAEESNFGTHRRLDYKNILMPSIFALVHHTNYPKKKLYEMR